MPHPLAIIAVIALGVGGVALAMGGRKGCKMLDSASKANAWTKANENRRPETFLMLGVWLRGPDGVMNEMSQAFLESICDDPPAETVAFDFQALLGKQIDFLESQGMEQNFPDENVALAFRAKPRPQVFFGGGDQPDQLEALEDNLRKFFVGEIEGQPIELPGASYTKGHATQSVLVK